MSRETSRETSKRRDVPPPPPAKRRPKGAVIVSGGTYGIGRAITIELATRGWPVVAFGLEAPQPGSMARDGIRATRKALAEAGVDAELLEADVSRATDVARVVEGALRAHGGLAAIVNNAAVRPTGTVLETDEATFDRVLAVNLKGPFLLARAAIPHLRAAGGGTVVNVGSRASRGRRGLAAYAASKGGLLALTLALARDHADDGIRAHLVVPAPRTASGMLEAIEAAEATEAEGARPGTAPGPLGSPAEVARVVASLLEPDRARATETVIEIEHGIDSHR